MAAPQLPYPAPDRLMMIFGTQPDCATCPASYPKYINWRNENTVFEVIGGSVPASAVLTELGEPEQIAIASTTASLFRVFAVPPVSGRCFSEEEDKPGGPAVAILSYGFWQRRLGANPQVIGSVVTIDGVARTVVGVMPRGFAHRGAEVWIPLARAVDERSRNSHFLATYGRLKPGVPYAQARQDMIALGGRLAREHDNMGHGIDIKPYKDRIAGRAATPLVVRSVNRDPAALVAAIRRELAAIDPVQPLANVRTMTDVVEQSVASPRLMSRLISGFAGLAGLLATIGVYGLVSYSVSQRTRESGLRMAIGADRRAVFALVFRRGIALAAAGIGVGALAALALTRLLTTLLYEVAPTDPAVFVTVCLSVLVAALVACYMPARAATRVDPMTTLRTT